MYVNGMCIILQIEPRHLEGNEYACMYVCMYVGGKIHVYGMCIISQIELRHLEGNEYVCMCGVCVCIYIYIYIYISVCVCEYICSARGVCFVALAFVTCVHSYIHTYIHQCGQIHGKGTKRVGLVEIAFAAGDIRVCV